MLLYLLVSKGLITHPIYSLSYLPPENHDYLFCGHTDTNKYYFLTKKNCCGLHCILSQWNGGKLLFPKKHLLPVINTKPSKQNCARWLVVNK